MANTDLPNAKIIILFILSKVDSIPSAKLTDCALESLYVDYFPRRKKNCSMHI